MDPRAIADLVREIAGAQGDDLTDRDVAEIISVVGLPREEKHAEIQLLTGDLRSGSPDVYRDDGMRTIRVKRNGRVQIRRTAVERVAWNGLPRTNATVPREETGAIPFMRPDSPATWAARVRECARGRIERLRQQAANRSRKEHGGSRKRAYYSHGGSYHA